MGSKSGDLIRNTIIIVLSSIIYGIIITGCSDNTSFKSTELNNVFIDNLNIGSSIQNINLKKWLWNLLHSLNLFVILFS